MFENYRFTAAERFLRYVQIDTQSDPQSSSYPTTEKQKNLSRILADELKLMGITDAHMDDFGYVYATIPSNSDKKVPVICFCAHVDTAPDCSGSGTIHRNRRFSRSRCFGSWISRRIGKFRIPPRETPPDP